MAKKAQCFLLIIIRAILRTIVRTAAPIALLGRKTLLLFVTLLLSSVAASANEANNFSFQQFFKAYGTLSLSRIEGENRRLNTLQQAQNNLDVAQGEFFVTPSLNHLKRRFPETPGANDISNRSVDIQGGYRQAFSTGTQLELRGQKFLERSNPLFTAIDSDYSFRVSQDLIRNRFGRGLRAQKKLGMNQVAQAKEDFRQSELSICSEAFDLYVDAHALQNRLELLQAQFNDSERSYRKMKRQQRKGLIHEVDALSSKNDFLDIQSQLLGAKQEYANGKRQLALYLSKESVESLIVPSPENGLLPLATILQSSQENQNNPSKTLRVQRAERQIQSEQIALTQQKQNTLSDLKLNFQLGTKEGRFNQGPANSILFSENYLGVSLDWKWPLFQKGADSSYRTAIQRLKNSKLQRETLVQSLEVEQKNLLATEELFNKQLDLNRRRLAELQKKSRLAYKQMSSGRIEYETYLLHKNAVRNLQLQNIELQRQEWKNRFTIQRFFASMDGTFCRLPQGES